MDLPFRVGEMASGPDFTGRRAEVTRIRQAMWNRGRVLVTGVRGQGKRSTVAQAFHPVGGRGGILLRADLGITENTAELLRRWVAEVPRGWRQRTRLLEFLRSAGLRPETAESGPGGRGRHARRKGDAEGARIRLGIRSQTLTPGEAEAQLGALLQWLNGVAAHHPAPIVLVLDEAHQAERIHSGGFELLQDWMSTTQNLPWILSGSPHAAAALIDGGATVGGVTVGSAIRRGAIGGGARAGPASGSGLDHLELGPIPEKEMADWIDKQVQGHGVEPESGVGRRILEVAGPRTLDRIRLSRRAYLRSLGRGRLGAEEVEAAHGDLILEGAQGFEHLWQEFPAYQRAVIRAVAAGVEQLHSQKAAFEFELPVSSAVSKGVRILREKGHLSEGTPTTLTDPFFRDWVLLRAMPACSIQHS